MTALRPINLTAGGFLFFLKILKIYYFSWLEFGAKEAQGNSKQIT